MRNLGFDVVLVGTVNACIFNVAVEDAQVEALADQHFGQLYQRAFTQIVSAGLEAQTQQCNLAGVVAGNHVESVLHLRSVTAHQRVEQGSFNVQAAGAVGQGANVFRQAGAAECEARAHVVLGQVQRLVLADHVHHFTAIDADGLGNVADFVGESNLGGVPHVAGVLDHLGNGDVLADDRCIEFFVQRLQNVARGFVELADDGHWRQVVVLDRSTFAQELRVDGDTEVNAGFLAGAVFQNRDNNVGNSARQYSTANHDSVAGGFVTQDITDFAAHRFNVIQFQIAVLLARRTDADHRQIGSANGFGEVCSAAQFSGTDTFLQQLFQTRFNDR